MEGWHEHRTYVCVKASVRHSQIYCILVVPDMAQACHSPLAVERGRLALRMR
jgi:hypothetical protein